MGDIIGIYDESGSKVAGYIYDAWGNCTVQTYGTDARIGEVNPFRYRGYYYDSDLGLYYLKSRYYDAKVGRFINADGIEYLGANGDLGSYNLFAYCGNNPIKRYDPRGHFWELIVAVVVTVLVMTMMGSCELGPTRTMLTDDEYKTYEDALNAANESVYNSSIQYKGYVDENGNVYEYGAEHSADIYYDTTNEVFRITRAYTQEKEDENKYLELLNNDGTYIMVGYTHFHPDIEDGSLSFSPEDMAVAETLGVACHIVNALNEKASYDKYAPNDIISP